MRKRIDKSRYSKFFVYLVVVILLNVAGITLFFRVDLTSNKVYSLSEASENVVSTLSEPLTVKVFFNDNLPAPYNNIERYLHDLLEEYAIAGGRRFNYEFHSVSGEDSAQSARNRELAESYGINPVQVQNIEQDEVKFQKAYMGIALIHGDVIETLPAVTATEGIEYQITAKIRRMNNKISALLTLEDKITAKLILSSSLAVVGTYMNIPDLADLPGAVEKIVDRLNDKNYGRLSFAHLDPTARPADAEQAERYDALRLNWEEFRDRSGKIIPAGRGYAGLVVEHGNNMERIDLIEVIRLPIFGTQYQLADMSTLEENINKAAENVIDINEEIGYLAGHGTPSIAGMPQMFGGMQRQDSLSSLNRLLSEEYSVKQVDVSEDEIPPGLRTLIIAGPREPFSEYGLYRIDQFLMEGKNLAIFLDPFQEVRPQAQPGMMTGSQRPYYVPSNTGLEKLLSHYGLNVRKSVVLDENSFKERVNRAFGGGERQVYYAPIIKSEMINREVAYLNNIKGLIMLLTAPVTVDDQRIKDNDLEAASLFSSSERAWEMKDRFDPNPAFISPPRDEKDFKRFPLAYVVEGSFPSYFADRQIPVKEKSGTESGDGSEEVPSETAEDQPAGVDMSEIVTEGETIKRGRPGKIFLIGTSEILKDNIIDEAGRTPNAQFVLNVIDYLNGREDIAVMRSKTQTFNPLKEVRPITRTAVKTINIAGLPILVILCGLVVWFRRSSRKKILQKIFS